MDKNKCPIFKTESESLSCSTIYIIQKNLKDFKYFLIYIKST